MFIHHSLNPDVMPGGLTADSAQQIAEIFGKDAFYCTDEDAWFMWEEDCPEDGGTEIPTNFWFQISNILNLDAWD